jgi:hypothetical protein
MPSNATNKNSDECSSIHGQLEGVGHLAISRRERLSGLQRSDVPLKAAHHGE